MKINIRHSTHGEKSNIGSDTYTKHVIRDNIKISLDISDGVNFVFEQNNNVCCGDAQDIWIRVHLSDKEFLVFDNLFAQLSPIMKGIISDDLDIDEVQTKYSNEVKDE